MYVYIRTYHVCIRVYNTMYVFMYGPNVKR